MTSPKETREADFLALNHRGKTPVFVDPVSDDGSTAHQPIIVNESLAILQYVETYHKPEAPLLPPLADRAGRALVLARVQETEILHNAYDALEDAHYEKGILEGPLAGEVRIKLIYDIFCRAGLLGDIRVENAVHRGRPVCRLCILPAAGVHGPSRVRMGEADVGG